MVGHGPAGPATVSKPFDLSGFKELDQALGKLEPTVARRVLERVSIRALKPVDDDRRALSPHLSGDLEESGGIGTKLSRSQRQAHAREFMSEVFAGPGPNPQAIQQEFGNAHHLPQPSLTPAWEANKDQVFDTVKTELPIEILKTAAREGRRRRR